MYIKPLQTLTSEEKCQLLNENLLQLRGILVQSRQVRIQFDHHRQLEGHHNHTNKNTRKINGTPHKVQDKDVTTKPYRVNKQSQEATNLLHKQTARYGDDEHMSA